jgi:hypothetical protein
MGEIKGIKDGTRGCAFNNRFQFEAIEATTTQGFVGYLCGDTYYQNRNYSGNKSRFYRDEDAPCYFGQLSASETSIESYSFIVDEFGLIAIGLNNTTTQREVENFSIGCDEPEFSNTNLSYFYQRTAKENSCEEDTVFETGEPIAADFACPSPLPPITVQCTTINCSGPESCERTSTTYQQNCQWSPNDDIIIFILTLSKSLDIRLSETLDWSFFFGLTKSSATKKLTILENNNTQVTIIDGDCSYFTCGSEPDACWSSWNFTTIVDTGEGAGAISATSQKWKTRVRKVDLNDAELQKYIITVESKYYLQIPVEDSDPIRILVDSGTDIFSGNQNRGSTHSFTNEDFQAQIGQPVYGCINITRIDRL